MVENLVKIVDFSDPMQSAWDGSIKYRVNFTTSALVYTFDMWLHSQLKH